MGVESCSTDIVVLWTSSGFVLSLECEGIWDHDVLFGRPLAFPRMRGSGLHPAQGIPTFGWMGFEFGGLRAGGGFDYFAAFGLVGSPVHVPLTAAIIDCW